MMAAAINVQVAPVIVIDCEMRCLGLSKPTQARVGEKPNELRLIRNLLLGQVPRTRDCQVALFQVA